MATMKKILDSTLKKITPSQQEYKQLNTVVEKVKKTTNTIIKPLGYSMVLAGSFSRDTWLSHKKEFDIFILFPESYSKEKLETEGLSIGKKIEQRSGVYTGALATNAINIVK